MNPGGLLTVESSKDVARSGFLRGYVLRLSLVLFLISAKEGFYRPGFVLYFQ